MSSRFSLFMMFVFWLAFTSCEFSKITVNVVPNSLSNSSMDSISISNLQVTSITINSFDISVDFTNDLNSNATMIVEYCNRSIDPVCVPSNSLTLIRGGASFTNSVIGLSAASFFSGENILVRTSVSDINGVNTSYLETTITLAIPSVTQIYRSVGFGKTTALQNGAGNNLTITSGVASFTSAILDNIGIGDAIVYDSDNNSTVDLIVFITNRNSSTSYTVATAAGTIPADLVVTDQDWSIFRAYDNLFNAENGIENAGIPAAVRNFEPWSSGRDLVTNGEKWNIAIYQEALPDNGAAIFSGWTTSFYNSIRIFTPVSTNEVGVSQRHEGTFLTGAQHTGSLRFGVSNIELDGLSYNYNGSSYDSVILTTGISAPANRSFFTIKNCLLRREVKDGLSNVIKFDHNVVGGVIRVSIVNNIINLLDKALGNGNAAILLDTNTHPTYIYNNNIISESYGVKRTTGNVHLKNNIIAAIKTQNSGSIQDSGSLVGSYQDIIANTFSSDFATWTAGAIRTKLDDTSNLNQENKLLNLKNINRLDYRISGDDFTAIASGVDLSADSLFAFNKDMNEVSRALWDRGASVASKMIYRSVGVSQTTAVANGAGNNLTISLLNGHSVATFDSSLSGNIGVGDALVYDSSQSGIENAIIFLTRRIDSQNFYVKTNLGINASILSVPTDIWDIYRSYTLSSDAITGVENVGIPASLRDFDSWSGGRDIVANNEQWNIAFYANGGEYNISTIIVDSPWTSNSNNYLRLFSPIESFHVGTSQRHSGVWDGTKWSIRPSSSNRAIRFNSAVSFIRMDGLQIEPRGNSVTYGAVLSYSNHAMYDSNILRGAVASPEDGHGITIDGADNVSYIFNNVIYDYQNSFAGTDVSAIKSYVSNSSLRIFNNTIEGCEKGISISFFNVAEAKNNLVQNISLNLGFDSGPTAFKATSNGNISEDTTYARAPADTTSSTSVVFSNSGGFDFSLDVSEVFAKSSGDNLSFDSNLRIYKNILNQSRGTTWSSGAF